MNEYEKILDKIMKKYRAFYAFTPEEFDRKKEQYTFQGEAISIFGDPENGIFVPSQNYKSLKNSLAEEIKTSVERIRKNNAPRDILLQSMRYHEVEKKPDTIRNAKFQHTVEAFNFSEQEVVSAWHEYIDGVLSKAYQNAKKQL